MNLSGRIERSFSTVQASFDAATSHGDSDWRYSSNCALESTVRYFGIEVDALEMAEQTEV